MKLPPILSIIALSANILESNAQTDCLDFCENYVPSSLEAVCKSEICGGQTVNILESNTPPFTPSADCFDICENYIPPTFGEARCKRELCGAPAGMRGATDISFVASDSKGGVPDDECYARCRDNRRGEFEAYLCSPPAGLRDALDLSLVASNSKGGVPECFIRCRNDIKGEFTFNICSASAGLRGATDLSFVASDSKQVPGEYPGYQACFYNCKKQTATVDDMNECILNNCI